MKKAAPGPRGAAQKRDRRHEISGENAPKAHSNRKTTSKKEWSKANTVIQRSQICIPALCHNQLGPLKNQQLSCILGVTVYSVLMERKTDQPTFMDALVLGLGGPRTMKFLSQCEALIPWDALAASIADVFPGTPRAGSGECAGCARGRSARVRGSRGGRPHWPVKLYVKCMMLQKWFGLSDPQLEEQLRDRLSFRRFVGLGLADPTPDETTFVNFRKRLRESGHGSTLFDGVLEQLRSKGLVLEEGSLVDATIVEQATGGKNQEGQSTRDRAASFTKKHGRTYHGYKAHVNVSKDRLVTDYVFDTAKVHDSQHIDGLIEGETKAVWADSAYMKEQRSQDLAERGVHDGIVRRRVRGQAELTEAQQAHNRAASKVRALVEHPFAWMGQMGYGRARYRGLRRNGLDFGLTALAYNIKRSLSLLGMALCPVPSAA